MLTTFHKTAGLTLVELLIAMAAGSILIAATTILVTREFGISREQTEQVRITEDARVQMERMSDAIRDAQSRDENGDQLATTGYTLFQGTTYNAAAASNEIHPFPADIEMETVSVTGGGSDIIFDSLTGHTSQSGTIRLRLISNHASTQTITVSSEGQADLSGTVSPSGTRVSDTRHVHFALNWTIKNTTTLRFAFSNPSVTINVPMSSYFNADQSDFDYTGDLDVNGNSETFHVQSHSIDATHTTLSIERDRRYDNVAVAISIDGHSIVSYTNTGTATVGADGGTMQIQ